jgi:hypothetical protein
MHTSQEVTSLHELQHDEEKRRCVHHFLRVDNTGLAKQKVHKEGDKRKFENRGISVTGTFSRIHGRILDV